MEPTTTPPRYGIPADWYYMQALAEVIERRMVAMDAVYLVIGGRLLRMTALVYGPGLITFFDIDGGQHDIETFEALAEAVAGRAAAPMRSEP